MNDKTKRDVLVNAVDALANAQASSDNNVGLGHQDADLFMAEYEKALPDDLPVIPKAVSDYINDAKASHYELLDAMAKWTLDQPVFDWIHENSDTFARAWLDGYEVESNEPNRRGLTTVKNYYQIDKDHDLSSLLEMGLIKDVASFYEGNIFKYVYRHRNKNGLDDLKKARNYLDLLMELEYGAKTKDTSTDEAHERLERLVKKSLELEDLE